VLPADLSAVSAAPASLRFGVSKNHGGAALLDGARRFADALGAALGQPGELKVAFDYDELVARLLRGSVDVAWLPPLAHARAQTSGAELVAVVERGGAQSYRSALLVRRDAKMARLRDLASARVAWVDPRSASGYLFPRNHLLAHGVDPARQLASEKFYGQSSLACAAVARGEADLCAVYVTEAAADRARAEAEVRAQFGTELRVLDVTDSIPPDGVVVSPRLAPPDRARVRDALLALHRAPDGEQALKSLMQATRLAPPGPEVARALARLRLR
jgi:phosphonate transport system substrate-binding protein